MKDSHKQKGLRKKLVLELFKKGIRDEKVLNAINLIPRHLFLHKDFENFAYIDKPFQIGEDQTISKNIRKHQKYQRCQKYEKISKKYQKILPRRTSVI